MIFILMEMFNSEQVANILWKKRVVVIGDSIQRSIYKDLVRLLVPDINSTYLTSQHLKTKGELEFLGDKLLQGGQLGEMNNGINYREVRQFNNGTTIVTFYFVTRCYSEYMMSVLQELKAMQPHVVIMNSCLWDLHRYGPYGSLQYIVNMVKLMEGLKKAIPSDAVFIWNATLPLDSKCKGGFLLPYFENIPSQEIIEANSLASNIVHSHGFIFLDLYSVFVNCTELREKDGTHWNHLANRIISNHVLTILSCAWNLPVPKPLQFQDQSIHRPLSGFSHNPFNQSMAPSIGNRYGLPQMVFRKSVNPSTEYCFQNPTIQAPRNLHPLLEFSSKPSGYLSSGRSDLTFNDSDINRILKNNQSFNQYATPSIHCRCPVTIKANHPLSTSLLGRNPFYIPHRLPEMLYQHTPTPSAVGTSSLNTPDRTQRELMPHQEYLSWNSPHQRNAPFLLFQHHEEQAASYSYRQQSGSPEFSRPCHPLSKIKTGCATLTIQTEAPFKHLIPYSWT